MMIITQVLRSIRGLNGYNMTKYRSIAIDINVNADMYIDTATNRKVQDKEKEKIKQMYYSVILFVTDWNCNYSMIAKPELFMFRINRKQKTSLLAPNLRIF